MRNKKFMVLVMTVMALLVMPSVFATSLWVDDSTGLNLFADHKAGKIGDNLTIIINETSKASRSSNSSNKKEGSVDLQSGTGIFDFSVAATASGSDKSSSSGAINNSNSVTGTVTVQVIEVKPNGNLVVSGTQSIKQNKDLHQITITGVVRPDDIKPDNTVLSSYVANAEVKFDGKGPLNSKQRQGILTQVFNILF